MNLSLIITVYNAENYIVECLESIVHQLPQTGLEVVIVDDGSSDTSMLQVRAYLERQTNSIKSYFRIFVQKNMGVSGARNTGIRESMGEYISFLDSDDILELNYFTTILNIINKGGVDIIQFEAYKFNNKGDRKKFLISSEYEGEFLVDELMLKSLFKKGEWYVCFRIYKKKLFDSKLFPMSRCFEDAYLVPELTLNAKVIYFVRKNLMGYRANPSSITNIMSTKNIDDLEWVVVDMARKMKKEKIYTYSFIKLYKYLLHSSLNAESLFLFFKRYYNIRREYSLIFLLKTIVSSNSSVKNIFFCIFPVFYSFALYFLST